jgi:hypothetical protein
MKFKSAKEKELWLYQQSMYAKLGVNSGVKISKSKKEYVPNYTHRSSTQEINSIQTNKPLSGTAKEVHEYTGDLVKGIALMHKSCLQPVISQEQMIESATMRR